VLTQPPVPRNRVSGKALVFVEDKNKLGSWSFGAGSLFNLVYLNPELHQEIVPVMDEVKEDDRIRWLRNKNAFFFRYDDQYHWSDATEQFRNIAKSKTDMTAVVLPKITTLGPPGTKAGIGFNVQPDGSSALSVNGQNFESGSKIILNGKPQSTAFGNDQWLTTTVQKEVYSQPGIIRIQVKNPDGVMSNIIDFPVLP